MHAKPFGTLKFFCPPAFFLVVLLEHIFCSLRVNSYSLMFNQYVLLYHPKLFFISSLTYRQCCWFYFWRTDHQVICFHQWLVNVITLAKSFDFWQNFQLHVHAKLFGTFKFCRPPAFFLIDLLEHIFCSACINSYSLMFHLYVLPK